MITEAEIALPVGSTVPIAFIRAFETGQAPTSPISFLHAVRSDAGRQDPELLKEKELAYNRLLPSYLADYCRWARRHPLDAMVKVPSCRNDADPYLNALNSVYPNIVDISNCYKKNQNWRAGQSATLQEAITNIIQVTAPTIVSLKRIAIVDDPVSSGISISAILHHLRTSGLKAEQEVWLIVPLCMMTLAAAP